MSYIPLSRIKPSLYTEGKEFMKAVTGEEYRGYYYKTSKGELFTGKNPSTPPNDKLLPLKINITVDITSKPNTWVIREKGYKVKQDISFSPISTYPSPTKDDYDKGEFQRYFLKKTNELKYIEVSKDEWGKYKGKDNSVLYALYQPFSIPWVIKGEYSQVYNENKITVENIEKKQKLYGLGSYFKKRFDSFYKKD